MLFRKTPFLLSLLCILAAVIAVILLVVFSGNPFFHKSGFNRIFFDRIIQPLYHSQKVKGARAICGIQKNHIYFETDTAGYIVETDSALLHPSLLKFQLPGNPMIQTLYTTFIDSSSCYIMAGNVAGVIQIDLATKSSQAFRLPGSLYSVSVVLGNNNYVFRCYQKTSGKWDQVFIKGKPGKNSLHAEQNISEKKGDAGFSTDGNLVFDKSTQSIVYVEYYRNEFICLDTSLNLLYKGSTIDTFKNATVRASWNTSGRSSSITNGSPLHEINLESKAANGKLYIHSAVKADNEKQEVFSRNSAIDLYQVPGGHYLGSFYVPGYKGETLKEFEVTKDKIIVMYDHYVVIYSNPFNML